MAYLFKLYFLTMLVCSSHLTWSQSLNFITPRIINGESVERGAFQGVVALTYKGNALCSGSLVTPTKIITAAHCILPVEVPGEFKDFETEVGVYIGEGLEGGILPTHYKVKNYWVHPQYRNHPFGKNDLAILELDREVKDISPVKILDSIESIKKNLKNEADITIMGYGYRENTINEYPSQVKTLVGRKFQTQMTVKSMNSNEIYLEASETGPCTGDSGGPAFININNHNYLVGVASRVTGPCGHISTGVFYGLIADSACWLSAHGVELTSFKQVCSENNKLLTSKAIERVIGKKNILETKELDLSNQYINTLNGITKFKNLEVLNIEGNKIKDLSALLALTKLRKVYIAGNDISDESMKGFQQILIGAKRQLHNHFKTDFYLACEDKNAATSNDQSIVNEIMSYTQSNDCYSAHMALLTLATLDLTELGLTSIDILKGYNKFTLVYLDGNRLSDLSIVENMRDLETLYFSKNKVHDLAPLLKLNKLQYVDASYNEIQSVDSLVSLDYFLMINLSGNLSLDKNTCQGNKKLRCL